MGANTKHALNELNNVRAELMKNKNPDKNMTNLNKGLDKLSDALGNELNGIKNMKNIKQDPNKEDSLGYKLAFEGFSDVIEMELMTLLDACKKRLDVPKYEKKGLDFTVNNKEKGTFEKLEESIKDELSDLRIKFDKETNITEIFFRYLNLRD
mmetsp:Transcript_10891/g.9401  ORF Transcript_10891/g.9401 Transcript_10891/m.9401 type:complete len:153 (+) Transcript_10891:18-476(+)